MVKKSILFVTGTRADFGKMEPLAIAARDAGHEVGFWVTGMHMLDRYGLTKKEVARTEGVGVYEYLNQRPGDPQDHVLAKTVTGFSDFVAEHRPDLVVVHGDRIEALACALVAATNYIRSAHIEGGEVSGTIDEIFRHCNSKLASRHFVSSEDAKRRVMAMGEPEDEIYVIGSPELDFHSARPVWQLKMYARITICRKMTSESSSFTLSHLRPTRWASRPATYLVRLMNPASPSS